jgi:hypothetical protein
MIAEQTIDPRLHIGLHVPKNITVGKLLSRQQTLKNESDMPS